MLIGRGISLRIIPVILFSLCVLSGNLLYGQNSCSQTLKEAQKSYEQGQLINIPEKLKVCMTSGFSKIEKLQAYRLIILTYLFLDEQTEAENQMNNLLVFEPDYKPNNALDPIEYINLYKSFRVEPFISLGAVIGANQSRIGLVNNFGVGNVTSNLDKYTPGIGLNFGVSADLILYRKLFITLDGYFSFKNYSSSYTVLSNSQGASSRGTSNEAQNWFNVPITLKYIMGNGKLKFFIRGGGAFDFLLLSQNQLVRKNLETSQNDFAGPNLDFSGQRNRINFSIVGGLGLTYKLGYGFLIVDARYMYGLTNIINTDARYKNFDSQITNYGYIDNDLRLTNLQISVGYMHSIFQVKKNKKSKSSQ
jgi:hypothetical protein